MKSNEQENNKEISVGILGNRKLIARTDVCDAFPQVNIYLDKGDGEEELICSIEDSEQQGLRIFAYNDLLQEEYTTVLEVR